MTCRDLVASLIDLIDGELSGSTELASRRHMASCGDCRMYAENYETAVALGRSLGSGDQDTDGEIPEELVFAILAARRGPPRSSLLA